MKALPGKPWMHETIYHEGDGFFADLTHAIAAANKSIDFETYIFDLDQLGCRILKLLGEAAKRGVRVRLLLDGFGCSQWSRSDLAEVESTGVEAKFYHPLPWQKRPDRFWRFPSLRRTALGLLKLNRRNHRKSCVIDGEVAFVGGMNVSDRHLAQVSGTDAWRDTSARVRGGSLQSLTKAFELAWAHARSAFRESKKQRKADHKSLLHQLAASTRRIWITNPYFVPDLGLVRVLRFAAWAGIDVRILVPDKIDVWGIRWAIQAYYFSLLHAKVRIFEYRPSILHAKVMIVDDWATVGSSNLNHRSLLYDLEVDVELRGEESIRSLEDQFLHDLSRSKEIDAQEWVSRSWMTRLLERFALVFRKWM